MASAPHTLKRHRQPSRKPCEWTVEERGKRISTQRSQAEAEKVARDEAIRAHAELVVHGRDGRIERNRGTYTLTGEAADCEIALGRRSRSSWPDATNDSMRTAVGLPHLDFNSAAHFGASTPKSQIIPPFPGGKNPYSPGSSGLAGLTRNSVAESLSI